MTTLESIIGHINNQHLEAESRAPQVFGGAYIGGSVGVETNWKCDSFSDYAKSSSITFPILFASITFGDGDFGVSLGVGFGLAIDTSPTSSMYSLSMTTEEYEHSMFSGEYTSEDETVTVTLSYFVSCDQSKNKIKDKYNRTVGYKGVAYIMDNNGNVTSQYDVTCGVDKDGNPNQQWETTNYTKNKENGY